MPKAKHRTKQPNEVNIDVRAMMYQLTGTDLTQIHGIEPFLALRLVAECGTDLSCWKTAKHFTSWLTLAPGCKVSGGKVLSVHTRKPTRPGFLAGDCPNSRRNNCAAFRRSAPSLSWK